MTISLFKKIYNDTSIVITEKLFFRFFAYRTKTETMLHSPKPQHNFDASTVHNEQMPLPCGMLKNTMTQQKTQWKNDTQCHNSKKNVFTTMLQHDA